MVNIDIPSFYINDVIFYWLCGMLCLYLFFKFDRVWMGTINWFVGFEVFEDYGEDNFLPKRIKRTIKSEHIKDE